MKCAINGYLFMEFTYDFSTPDYRKTWRPAFKEYKPEDDAERIFIRNETIELDAPDDFDPVPKQVAALEREKAEALAEFQAKVADINERLSKLQAITFEGETV